MKYRMHGDSYSQEYRSWKMMLSRCRNPNDPAYRNYGQRGITVCPRWHHYDAFLADMGRRPTPAHTLERKDNELGYTPDNCCWATRREQLRNRRNTRFVELAGKRVPLVDATALLGVPYSTLRHRANKGQPLTRRTTNG